MVRLQKYLADCGVASRRKAEELIIGGNVEVNGDIVTELGTKIEAGRDKVLYKGKEILPVTEKIYLLLNKPVGYVTTTTDQFGRPAVLDLLKDINERLFPVGRLDYNTSGLLIITNDGELAYKLTHPKHEIAKTYRAVLKGKPTEDELEHFRRGIMLEGRLTAKAEIKILGYERSKEKNSIAEIIIHEGRNRQIRKMCEAIGHDVIELERIAHGEIKLGNLKTGKYRKLKDYEIESLKGK